MRGLLPAALSLIHIYGFRQMRDAAKQGRVDNVLVYTLDGLSKRSKNYARFQRQIEKRHVLMYDRNGNLLIGA